MKKRCSKCNTRKVTTSFSLKRSGGTERRTVCKQCQLQRDNDWRNRNRDRVNQAAKRWRENNHDEHVLAQKRYRQKYPERVKQYERKYLQANRRKILNMRAARRNALKAEVFDVYSNKTMACVLCGVSDMDVLCLDHIADDGKKHRMSHGSGGRLYARLRKEGFPKGLQVLCANCNLKKEIVRKRKLRFIYGG